MGRKIAFELVAVHRCDGRVHVALRRRVVRGQALEAANEGGETGDLDLRLGALALQLVLVRLALRRVQLDQQLARFDVHAVGDVDGADAANLARLDPLDAAGRDDSPRRHRHDVDSAHHRPGDGDEEERGQRQRQGAPGRIGRCLQDLQRGGQELALSSRDPGSVRSGRTSRRRLVTDGWGVRGREPSPRGGRKEVSVTRFHRRRPRIGYARVRHSARCSRPALHAFRPRRSRLDRG